jgi:hypothetical protein
MRYGAADLVGAMTPLLIALLVVLVFVPVVRRFRR